MCGVVLLLSAEPIQDLQKCLSLDDSNDQHLVHGIWCGGIDVLQRAPLSVDPPPPHPSTGSPLPTLRHVRLHTPLSTPLAHAATDEGGS